MEILILLVLIWALVTTKLRRCMVEGKADVHLNKNNLHDRSIRFESLPISLILDGKVQDDSLEKLGKTRFWLKNQLQAKEVRHFKEVFFCSIDHRGKLFVDRKR